jgi:soluble lytic murein transglycosylase-like protein
MRITRERLCHSESRVCRSNPLFRYSKRKSNLLASFGKTSRSVAALLVAAALAPVSRAETVVLRNGLRFNVTGYQRFGERYRLQLSGGFVEVPAEEVSTIEPQLLFTSEPPKAEPAATGPYREFIQAAAEKYKVDADLISSVIAIESNFDPRAISRRNARGLMQLMPQTAWQLGVRNIFDPKQNIDGGTHLLHDLLKRYNNDLVLALAAYNAGTVRVVSAVPPIRETRNYVVKVKNHYDKRKDDQKSSQHKASTSDTLSLESAKADGN